MAILTKCLTSISPDLRSGPSPGRRLLAIALCAMLTFGSVFPCVAFAGEVDSEGVGTAPEVEVPVVPDFDPGGEETVLEEAPAASGGEEGAAETPPVEAEPELDTEVPSPEEVTSAVAETVAEEPEVPAVTSPELETSPAAPEYVPQQQVASEPVENQPLQAPRQTDDRDATDPQSAPAAIGTQAGESEESQPVQAEPSEEEPSSPAPASSGDSHVNLAGKRFYVVQPGDCLTYIAEALLPAGATEAEIEDKIDRLWRLNEERIGTGDRNLILVGTVLRLR